MTLSKLTHSKKRLCRLSDTVRVHVPISRKALEELDKVRRIIRETLDLKVSRALIFRNGGLEYARNLRVQVNKSLKGRFHGKLRKELL